jgi:hypothetical protein
MARVLGALALAAVLLASCGTTTHVSVVKINGTPAVSISVPLTTVGCTLNDVCIAVGTSSVSGGPSSVAEFVTPHAKWQSVAPPTTTTPVVQVTACTGTTCLIGGSSPGHDLLWQFSATTDSIVALTPPTGGTGIDALTCSGLNCALVDQGATPNAPRFSYSADGGATWSTPVPMSWAANLAITALSCGAVFDCLASAETSVHQPSLYETQDDGATWTSRAVDRAWSEISSLHCTLRSCLALASSGSPTEIIKTNNFGRTWKSLSVSQQANALACSADCIVVGHTTSNAWLATLRGATLTTTPLRYVPTPLIAVACGSKVCAAIGVTTVVTVPVEGSKK